MCYKANKERGAVDVVNHKLQATNHVFFYTKNVTLFRGKEYLGWHKLAEDTPTVRHYCTACGTPLGFKWHSNFNAFYGPLIKRRDDYDYDDLKKKKEDSGFPEAMYAFHKGNTPQKRLDKHSDRIKQYDQDIPIFPVLAHFMTRRYHRTT